VEGDDLVSGERAVHGVASRTDGGSQHGQAADGLAGNANWRRLWLSQQSRAADGLAGNANWRRLWLGQAISLLGDSVFDITMMLWVAAVLARGRPWAPAAASGVLVAEAVPVLLVGPVAGVFVDRWDRRRVMLAADVFRAVLVAGLLALPALGAGATAEIAVVYAVVAAQSAAAQFFNPSRLALLGRIVGPAGRAKAGGMLQATVSLATIAGEPLGALLLFSFGVRWACLIDAASFAGSFLAIRSIRLPRTRPEGGQVRPGFGAQWRAGLAFFAGNRVLLAISSGVIIAMMGLGAVNVLLVFFVTGNLHAPAGWLGPMGAAIGAGMVAGALASGWVSGRIGAGRVFCLGLIGCGLGLAVLSRMTGLSPAFVLIGVTGLAAGLMTATVPALLLAQIPQDMIGRVMGVFNPVQQLAGIVSMGLAGLLASTALRGLHVVVAGVRFGTVDAIFGAGALLVVTAGLAVYAPLRRAGLESVSA
jgi:MFS family permease